MLLTVKDLKTEGKSAVDHHPVISDSDLGKIRESIYLKGIYFRGKKISRISRILAKVAKINSFFDTRKCRFAKIDSRQFFQN